MGSLVIILYYTMAIDNENGRTVVLAVDTSYRAVGFYIYQESADTMKKKVFIKCYNFKQ